MGHAALCFRCVRATVLVCYMRTHRAAAGCLRVAGARRGSECALSICLFSFYGRRCNFVFVVSRSVVFLFNILTLVVARLVTLQIRRLYSVDYYGQCVRRY